VTIANQAYSEMRGRLFCFGFGYCAEALSSYLAKTLPHAMPVAGTQRTPHVPATSNTAIAKFDGTTRSDQVAGLLAESTHILLSIPPDAKGDPALRWHASDLAALKSLHWIGYLSTVGVYGDAGGGLVDETSQLKPQSVRGSRRVVAEEQWRAFGRETGKRVEIFRLPGIYGPGRSALDTVREGNAKRLIKPGQVFNRIHVADIAATLARAMAFAQAGVDTGYDTYNVVDDEPAPPQDVVTYAAQLLGVPPPPEIPYSQAQLSPMAQSFYSENKRVANLRLKSALGVTLAYPTYREGLAAIHQARS
jgi:nucleoside-diphosphate-sugar epimerase